MGQPVSARSRGWGRRLLAVVGVAIAAWGLAILLASVPPFRTAVDVIDISLYDSFYRHRSDEWPREAPVVIIAVDQYSIDRMASQENAFRWPWPREYWGAVLEYLQASGAKAVAVDLLFEEPSGYQNETGDDTNFAKKLDELRIPVIHAVQAKLAGNPRFAPPVTRPPMFGAVDVIDSSVIRHYAAMVNGKPSLAAQAVHAAGGSVPQWANSPFLLHFYNPEIRAIRSAPYAYIPAYDVVRAALAPDQNPGEANRANFRDKIVLIGATATATFDLKSAPMMAIFPSVQAHATAIDNLLNSQRVEVMTHAARMAVAFIAALLTTIAAILPRRVLFKVTLSLAALFVAFALGYERFTFHRQIVWLPLTAPLLAGVFGIIGGLSWTYFIEDRQRRAILKILSQYVSPEVARQLSRRGELSLGGERREMTVMFTDIEGFTTITETMSAVELEPFMNGYLGEVTGALHHENATIDKYIGDAVMAFWNAPLDQPDHAERACLGALRIVRIERERQVRSGQKGIHTRVGINTGEMVVGNMGSPLKANYTVLGDAVNLANRLEGSNKIYGSQILISETTARCVRGRFLVRRLDRLRVKGRSQPLEVYELLEELQNSDEGLKRLAERYEAALEEYRKQQWESAERVLVELAGEFPEDGPTLMLLERVREFRAHPPAPGWDGVHDVNAEANSK